MSNDADDLELEQVFVFDDGVKRLDECTRDELLFVVKRMGDEIMELREIGRMVTKAAAAYQKLHPSYEDDG